jgi:hypothetical protein
MHLGFVLWKQQILVCFSMVPEAQVCYYLSWELHHCLHTGPWQPTHPCEVRAVALLSRAGALCANFIGQSKFGFVVFDISRLLEAQAGVGQPTHPCEVRAVAWITRQAWRCGVGSLSRLARR